ncbi:D-isomer specific 2-hydroxyacid dehydrogenase family protein [Corynebacterium guangdongense]|uniref:Phosphoglycerate dehydrogenase-like enzyme n=1 Tax=Corynebacterium guangdongense TaxID=1783348 RepID=A0ABU2A1N7_9CORY|nr:D-isomer specific 2-hydroxyacid dehydrogenase family protein [Corynebacterium guangdongense]MDR7330033.1 phosphoglycerate dehydrogenase-like enzyme [Corynebacterium guangdongense]WJZ18591.1 D-specific alpha-keto acid dehydrogenase [Corynebacterium guangdongense]
MRFTLHPERVERIVEAVEAGGHSYVDSLEKAEFLIFHGGPADFPEPLPANVRFVQTQMAGIDALHSAGVLERSGVRWANAKGLYDETVAESCLALLLAVGHQHKRVGMAATWSVSGQVQATTQFLSEEFTVAVIGAGGIGRRLLELLRPFRCRTIAVNRSGATVAEAEETVAMSQAEEVWSRADAFILLAPLTEETHRLVDARALNRMKPNAIVVNAGRGPLVDTDALVDALRQGRIYGAGLDVTDPEPLPDGHPLWGMDNVVITPHTANTIHHVHATVGGLAARNADLFAAGERMATEVDIEAGY